LEAETLHAKKQKRVKEAVPPKIERLIALPIFVTNNLRKIEALQPAPPRTISHLFQHKIPQAPNDIVRKKLHSDHF
jgi:hypothetical protein